MVSLTPWARRRDFGDAGSLLDLRSEMDRLFDRFFESSVGWGDTSLGMPAVFTPAMDVYEEDSDIVASLEVPGMNPDDIVINVSGNALTVSGEKKEEFESSREGVYRSERRYGRFFRSLELPDGVDAENVSAEYDNGVLKVRIPRTEKRQSKRISVNVGSGASGRKQMSGATQQQPGRQQGSNQQASQRGNGPARSGESAPTSRGMSSPSGASASRG